MLLLAGLMAAAVRFWQLGDAPPGLYRDEALNGLDALRVLRGEHALFFAANNGREPAYIYLTALGIALFGRTALAIRFGAALVGTLTTWLVYRLAAEWFDRQTGTLAAFLWAITLWPIHLSRIGLRAILLVPLLTGTLWLGARAYRRPSRLSWSLAGAVYGASAYTYVAARFTPVFLVPLILYGWWRADAEGRRRILAGLPWALLGLCLVLAPLAGLAVAQPDLVLGRAGQVSLLNPDVNQGDLLGTLWRQIGATLGMFFWRGDTILRHNPAGRPVFDVLMTLPFGLGLIWAVRHWRQPAAAGLLFWTGLMLGPTILAEDAPHFLRAVGVLPAPLVLAALGLRQLANWRRLPARWGSGLVALLLAGSLAITISDYAAYVAAPDTAYLFEAGASDLAAAVQAEPAGTAVFLEQRLWDSWPSIAFLVPPEKVPHRFPAPEQLPPALTLPAAVYVWPYQPLAELPARVPTPALVSAKQGSLGRGDLEDAPYALYIRFWAGPAPPLPALARFGDAIVLREVTAEPIKDGEALRVDLVWSSDAPVDESLTVFVHLLDEDGIVSQDDSIPAAGQWPVSWWRPGLLVMDEHELALPEPYDRARHDVMIGLYETESRVRLPAFTEEGLESGDSWSLP